MPSKKALEIAERYIPDCGGDFGHSLRTGKVDGLARAIDALRVRDLERLIYLVGDYEAKGQIKKQRAALRAAMEERT